MELPFAGLHQLCAPLLGQARRLATPQQRALRVALGLASGEAPDRFLVALGALSLLAEVAEKQPLLCLVDDAQWLDGASRQVLGFVARRLLAESVVIVFGVREPIEDGELAGLPELVLGGLGEEDSRSLLATVIPGRIDERVRDRIVAETRGNPLALLELPRGLSPAQLAGGFGLPEPLPLSGRIEESFLRRLDELPDETRLLLAGRRGRARRRPGADVARRDAARRRRHGAGARGAHRAARRRRAGALPPPARALGDLPVGVRRRAPDAPTARWPTRPTPRSSRTGARGTARRPRAGPTRTSRPRWSSRPAGRRRAAGSPPPQRSSGAPRT